MRKYHQSRLRIDPNEKRRNRLVDTIHEPCCAFTLNRPAAPAMHPPIDLAGMPPLAPAPGSSADCLIRCQSRADGRATATLAAGG